MTSFAHSGLCPIQSEDLQIEEAGGEVIAFDTASNQFHLLNQVAYTILRSCNGVTRPKDIALALIHQFDVEGRSIAALHDDVVATLDRLHEQGLIAFIGNGAPPAVPDAEARDAGKDEAATVPAGARPLFAVAVEGTSMFPTLVSGDRVVASTPPAAGLRVGDVIVFTSEQGTRVAHRIIAIEPEAPSRITTKGDARPEPDAPIRPDQVIGLGRAVLRGGMVQWLRKPAGHSHAHSNAHAHTHAHGAPHDASHSTALPDAAREAAPESRDDAGPAADVARTSTMTGLKVLDLCDLPPDAIRGIAAVADVGLVLLSAANADAWTHVSADAVKSTVVVPDGFRVYTGQPELVPELLEFMAAPLRLVVNGQLFLTAFAPDQIARAFAALILSGQAYVGSSEAKAALEAVTTVVSGGVQVIPTRHARWIGESMLGPEYRQSQPDMPLVAVGTLTRSARMGEMADDPRVWHAASAAG